MNNRHLIPDTYYRFYNNTNYNNAQMMVAQLCIMRQHPVDRLYIVVQTQSCQSHSKKFFSSSLAYSSVLYRSHINTNLVTAERSILTRVLLYFPEFHCLQILFHVLNMQ